MCPVKRRASPGASVFSTFSSTGKQYVRYSFGLNSALLSRARTYVLKRLEPGELRRIVDAALATLSEADLVLLVVDVLTPDEGSETLLLEKLAQQNTPVVLALNKIDQVRRPDRVDPVADR